MSGAVGAGFYGKLPARGDFVRAGLPRSFVDPWDAWLQQVIAGSNAALGEAWREAWLEAPVWRFALPDGACGPNAVLGLWLPSVDRAGRYFPLTIAYLSPRASPALLEAAGVLWLDAAERVGRDALDADLAPELLAASLASATTPVVEPGETAATAIWWTEGSPRVPASRLALPALPDAQMFTRMLDAGAEARS